MIYTSPKTTLSVTEHSSNFNIQGTGRVKGKQDGEEFEEKPDKSRREGRRGQWNKMLMEDRERFGEQIIHRI